MMIDFDLLSVWAIWLAAPLLPWLDHWQVEPWRLFTTVSLVFLQIFLTASIWFRPQWPEEGAFKRGCRSVVYAAEITVKAVLRTLLLLAFFAAGWASGLPPGIVAGCAVVFVGVFSWGMNEIRCRRIRRQEHVASHSLGALIAFWGIFTVGLSPVVFLDMFHLAAIDENERAQAIERSRMVARDNCLLFEETFSVFKIENIFEEVEEGSSKFVLVPQGASLKKAKKVSGGSYSTRLLRALKPGDDVRLWRDSTIETIERIEWSLEREFVDHRWEYRATHSPVEESANLQSAVLIKRGELFELSGDIEPIVPEVVDGGTVYPVFLRPAHRPTEWPEKHPWPVRFELPAGKGVPLFLEDLNTLVSMKITAPKLWFTEQSLMERGSVICLESIDY